MDAIGQHSQCLFRLMVIGVEPVRRKLLNVSLGQPTEFGLAQTLSKVQEGLWDTNDSHHLNMFLFYYIHNLKKNIKVYLIVLHFIINIQL